MSAPVNYLVKTITRIAHKLDEKDEEMLESVVGMIAKKYGIGNGALCEPQELKTYPKRRAKWVTVENEKYKRFHIDSYDREEDFTEQLRLLVAEPWLSGQEWLSRFTICTHSRVREHWAVEAFVITGPIRRLVLTNLDGVHMNWHGWRDSLYDLSSVEAIPVIE